MTAFDVVLDTDLRTPVVRVTGELDIATAPQLERVLDDAAGTAFVIDLTPTTFCDSTGMTVILRAHKRAGEDGALLPVVCPTANAEVTRVLELLGFDRVLDLHETVDDAFAALDGGGSSAGDR